MFNIKVIENAPNFRPRPKGTPGYHQFSNGTFDAFVHEEHVLKKIAHRARQWRHSEIAGRLVGRVYRDDSGFWCVITGVVPADVTGGPNAVQTTELDAAHTVRALDEQHLAEDLLGWFHSHTLAFDDYSSVDRTNQTLWGKSYHLGLLISLHPGEVKIHAFRGPDSERLRDSYAVPNCWLTRPIQSPNATSTVSAPPAAPDVHEAPHEDRLLDRIAWPLILILAISAIVVTSRRQWREVDAKIQRLHVATEKIQTGISRQTRLLQSQQVHIQSESDESTGHWIRRTGMKILESLDAIMLENVSIANIKETGEGEMPHRPSFPTQDTEPRPTFASDQVGRQMTATR